MTMSRIYKPTAKFSDEPEEVLIHSRTILLWKNYKRSRISSPFPDGWEHKWYLSFSQVSGLWILSVHDGALKNPNKARFWVEMGGMTLVLDLGNSRITSSPESFGDYQNQPVDITIRVSLGKENIVRVEKRRKSCFEQIIKAQFSKGFLTDVELIANDGKSTSAHWEVLTARSSFFSSIRNHGYKESKTNQIKMDMNFQTLTTFLAFIYTGQVNFESVEMGKSMLKAGDMFLIDDLKSAAEDFLCGSLNVNNAIDLLVLADQHSTPLLGKTAVTKLKLKTFEPRSKRSRD